MYASSAGQPSLVSTLVSAGAGVNAQASSGWTALSRAALKGHASIITALLQAGADASLPSAGEGRSAAEHAAVGQHADALAALETPETPLAPLPVEATICLAPVPVVEEQAAPTQAAAPSQASDAR